MKGLLSKQRLMTVGLCLVAIAAINNVSQLEAVKKQINGDQGWF